MRVLPPSPLARQIVLVGGGHSHALLLRMHGMQPLPGARITLVSDVPYAPYSGMLPGLIAGTYGHDQAHIDLRRLAHFAGVDLVVGKVTGLDLTEKQVHIHGRPGLRYDFCSINIGSTPAMTTIPGATEWATPSKPVPVLLDRWNQILEAHGRGKTPKSVVIVGGGAGGVELALSMHQRLDRRAEVHLVHSARELLETHNEDVREKFTNVLSSRGIQVHTGERVVEVTESGVRCESGKRYAAEAVFWVTQASPAKWPGASGLTVDERGFILISDTLQSVSHPDVFAVGDVASIVGQPRPKSGVFAVRQAKPLYDNLRARLRNRSPKPYHAQKQFLSLIGTATGSAIASRQFLSWESPWMWRLKDWIDRRFMRKFEDLPQMSLPKAETAKDPLRELEARAQMRCLGCAAKVGNSVLRNTLSRLRENPAMEPVLAGLQDSEDAAIISPPTGQQLVQTVDYMPSMIADPYHFAMIATLHSLSDVFAMGAAPHGVLALVVLPFAADEVMEEMFFQVLSGVCSVLAESHAVLLGGHTAEGAALALGITANGFIEPNQVLRKCGMAPGDDLILTKALGVGALFAADMRLEAPRGSIDKALVSMLRSNGPAAAILRAHQATACTDVTGFGLLGHLLEMARPSAVGVELNIDALPIIPGATETTRQGIVSSLQSHNASATDWMANAADYVSHPHYPLLFDPQTSGGLLASVPPHQSAACLAALHAAGDIASTIIGRVTSISDATQPIVLK